MRAERILGVVTCLVVGSAIVLAFHVTGSPSHQRDIAIDLKRTSLLTGVSNELSSKFGGSGERLPAMLAASLNALDPVTHKPFEYRRIDATHYELCATFALASEPLDRDFPEKDQWSHSAGHVCFPLSPGRYFSQP